MKVGGKWEWRVTWPDLSAHTNGWGGEHIHCGVCTKTRRRWFPWWWCVLSQSVELLVQKRCHTKQWLCSQAIDSVPQNEWQCGLRGCFSAVLSTLRCRLRQRVEILLSDLDRKNKGTNQEQTKSKQLSCGFVHFKRFWLSGKKEVPLHS
jgi:hypothetical protein